MGVVISGLEQLERLIGHVATEPSGAGERRTHLGPLTLVPTDDGELAASGRVVSRPDGAAVVFDAPHAEAIMRI